MWIDYYIIKVIAKSCHNIRSLLSAKYDEKMRTAHISQGILQYPHARLHFHPRRFLELLAGKYPFHDDNRRASVLMQRRSYSTETVLHNKITRNRIVLSFKDSPWKPLRRRPNDAHFTLLNARLRFPGPRKYCRRKRGAALLRIKSSHLNLQRDSCTMVRGSENC